MLQTSIYQIQKLRLNKDNKKTLKEKIDADKKLKEHQTHFSNANFN